MNIFYLHDNPITAAQMHCDKHTIKMILESAQMLSTAHRLIDGTMYTEKNINGRSIKRWRLPDDRETILYKAAHVNHPCSIWVRKNSANYMWLYNHFIGLCNEYTHRYGKIHKSDRLLREALSKLPKHIVRSDTMTDPALAMLEECKVSDDPVECYRNYYETKQKRFSMAWTNRKVPDWFRFYDEEYIL